MEQQGVLKTAQLDSQIVGVQDETKSQQQLHKMLWISDLLSLTQRKKDDTTGILAVKCSEAAVRALVFPPKLGNLVDFIGVLKSSIKRNYLECTGLEVKEDPLYENIRYLEIMGKADQRKKQDELNQMKIRLFTLTFKKQEAADWQIK